MKNIDQVAKFGRTPALLCAQHAPAELASLARSNDRNADSTMQAVERCASGYGVEAQKGKAFPFAAGIAIIPVYGALLHRDPWCDSYATGYDYIGSRFAAALGDPEVKGILFDVNSYGGHVAGNFELCDQIFEARGKKPMAALVDSRALSGGYSIASSVGRIIATPSSDIGSIGVVMMHMSMEKALEQMGLDVTFIFAGKHKVDGNPFKDLPDDVKKALQASVEKSYAQFVALVARNRTLGDDAVRGTEARVYDADEAKSIGLIDEVMSPRAAFASFLSEVSSTSTQTKEVKKMSQHIANPGDGEGGNNPSTVSAADAAAQASTAASTARASEQTRIKGIIDSDEGKSRNKLANHLAFNTSMSVEDARACLAAAPEEKAEAAAPAATAAHDPLAAALKREGTPSVSGNGGDGEEGEPEKKQSRSERIAQNFARVTGTKLKTS